MVAVEIEEIDLSDEFGDEPGLEAKCALFRVHEVL
jgi:hypothetical protein